MGFQWEVGNSFFGISLGNRKQIHGYLNGDFIGNDMDFIGNETGISLGMTGIL